MNTITREMARVYFQKYDSTFSSFDIKAITNLWAFPAFITTPSISVCFQDIPSFEENTKGLCDFYRSQGVTKTRKTVSGFDLMFDGIASVRTIDQLYNSENDLIAEWEHSYLIRQTENGIRAIVAIADGELQAWAARGTPLDKQEQD